MLDAEFLVAHGDAVAVLDRGDVVALSGVVGVEVVRDVEFVGEDGATAEVVGVGVRIDRRDDRDVVCVGEVRVLVSVDAGVDAAALQSRIEELEAQVADFQAETADDGKSMVIVATKGTLDMAYPPLILASKAAAFDWDVTVFATFWGLGIPHEEHSKDLQLSAVGNPTMPVPNAIAALPGMDRVTTRMMNRRIADNDTATIDELVETSTEMGVELQACEMTIDLMNYDEDDFHDGVTTGGAATALQRMEDADIQLLV